MGLGFPTREVVEGKARILVPDVEGHHIPTSGDPVFYNPAMKPNRDTAVLALAAHTKTLKHPPTILEPLAGSGVRSIRLALEASPEAQITMGDLNPSAVKLATINASRNHVEAKIRLMDAHLLLALHSHPGGRADYVDIDPFGPPTGFTPQAVSATRPGGILALTATDLAPLCGSGRQACLRKYGGWPLRGEFCHETALRLLVASTARAAAVQECGVKPLYSYYMGHYVRAYFLVERGARRADQALRQLGFVKRCPSCARWWVSDDNHRDECPCGSTVEVGGPLWLGELSDPAFTRRMAQAAEEAPHLRGSKAHRVVLQVLAEQGFPLGFYHLDTVSRLVGAPSIPTKKVVEALTEKGHQAVPTHFHPRGVKTTASYEEVLEVVKALGATQPS